MSALIIVESYFGNTRHLAEIIAAVLRANGIGTEVISVEDAPTQIHHDIDLLVIGAPTHDVGLSTPETRQAASARLGRSVPQTGVREWAVQVTTPGIAPLVAVFDTRTGYPWLAGSAASQVSALLSQRGFVVLPARASFRVRDVSGPIDVGEDLRARDWAEHVGARLLKQLRAGHG